MSFFLLKCFSEKIFKSKDGVLALLHVIEIAMGFHYHVGNGRRNRKEVLQKYIQDFMETSIVDPLPLAEKNWKTRLRTTKSQSDVFRYFGGETRQV
jgi:FAD synthase